MFPVRFIINQKGPISQIDHSFEVSHSGFGAVFRDHDTFYDKKLALLFTNSSDFDVVECRVSNVFI